MKKLIIQFILLLSIISYSQTTPGEYTVNNLDSNSRYSDFGPAFFESDKIIFSSARGGGKKWDNDQPFLNLYEGTIYDDGSVSKIKKLSSNVNSKEHEASVSFSPDKKTVYFTRNNQYDEEIFQSTDTLTVDTEEKKVKKRRGERYKDKQSEVKGTTYIAMYKADIDENGQWTNIIPLPFNNRNYSVGHPTVNRDGTKLYFTSDMPGTYGGTDIFVTNILEDNNYSKPKNLGRKVNTLGREMFPFIDAKNILYFSSDSRKAGFGGLDIYAIKVYDQSLSDAIHLGEPINSEDDDFGFIINNDTDEGYFSSNKKGGKGDDDIYHFLASPPLSIECTQSVTGTVENTKTSQRIPNALISLINEKGDEIKTVKTTAKGSYNLAVPCDGNFKIIASKDEYKSDEKEFSTENNPDAKLDLGLNLEPKVICNQNVTGVVNSVNTSQPLSNALITILDKDGKELQTLKTSSTGGYSTKLSCESNFKIIASKDEYESSEKLLSTKGATVNGNKNLNFDLKRKVDLTEIKIVKNKVIVNIDPIYFELNKDNITKVAKTELNKVIAIMNKYPALIIEGGSHTDVRGKNSTNLDLSIRRANSTVAYIVDKGIDSKRIKAKGYGETQPTNRCTQGVKCSNEEHAQNRRTEFVILNPDVLGYITE